MSATLTIRCFGLLAELCGTTCTLDFVPATVAELRQHLLQRFPELGVTPFSVARNLQVVEDDVILSSTDVVALLPPFSGG